MATQLMEHYGALVLCRSGLQTLEIMSNTSGSSKGSMLCVCNGFLTDWIVCYEDGTWAQDGVFTFNKPIRNYLNKFAFENKGKV